MNKHILLGALLVLAALPVALPTADACSGCDSHVCVRGVTEPACADGHDVCLSHGYEVPYCTDLPTVTCGPLVCGPKPVSVCVKENACGPNGDDACVTADFVDPPSTCVGFTCACMPMQATLPAPQVGVVPANGLECINNCQPLVYVCARGVNAGSCYGGHDVCFGTATSVPSCHDVPCYHDNCIVVQDPCQDLRPVCDHPTDPCSWGWLECYCNPSICNPPPMGATLPLPQVGSAQTQSGGGECMQWYYEMWIAPGTGFVQRDSCHREWYVNGEHVLG